MAEGQFIQIASVALHIHQGTVRETMVTVVYALDSLGDLWKLIDQSGQKWTLMTRER
jgi:Tfp pilus tip-associated adhesin PilY1